MSSSTNSVIVIEPSVNEPYSTVPLAVILTTLAIEPLLILSVPSVIVVELKFVKPVKAPAFNSAVPSVNLVSVNLFSFGLYVSPVSVFSP